MQVFSPLLLLLMVVGYVNWIPPYSSI
jgi:hypothetical protein